MIELLAFAVVGVLVWAIYRSRRPRPARRSPEALIRETSGQDYRPDPLAHLDIPSGGRSIVALKQETAHAEAQSASLTIRTYAAETADTPKPRDADYHFEIEYIDRAGKATKRRIALVYHEADGDDTILHAYCELAQADRRFRSSRIKSCKNLWTGRTIKDLGRYFRSGSYLR